MPLFMDVHDHPDHADALAPAVAERRFGVRRLQRWVDGKTGRTFFLIDAPDRAAAVRLHQEVHKAQSDTLVEVREDAW
jgi:hypothetical protein